MDKYTFHLSPGSLCLLLVVTLYAPMGEPEGAEGANAALHFGVFPRRNPQLTLAMFKPLADYLSKSLDREIKLVVSKDYESFWQAVSEQQFDLVHYNQYHYIKSVKLFNYKVILKNEEFGSDTVSSALVIRKDSSIKSIGDLRGKKILFGGGPTAMVSYIQNVYLLRKAGLKRGDYVEEFSVSPPNAVYAVYFGHADSAGAGAIALQLPAIKRTIDPDELTYLAKGRELAHIPWAVRGSMSPKLRKHIQSLLINLKTTKEGRSLLANAGLTGLNMAADSEYDEHRRLTWLVSGENYCVRHCDKLEEAAITQPKFSPLYMSIFPRREKRKTQEIFNPIAEYLARELGREVILETHKTFSSLWQGIKEQRYDLLHVNQLQYIKSHKLYGYDAILKNEEFGVSTITPAIYVRKDSEIKSVKDIKGKKIIFGGGKLAMVSYVGNLQLLQTAGLAETDYKWSFATTPPNGCHAMYLGQADACGAAEVLLKMDVFRNKVDITNIRKLKSGVPLSHVTWAVKQNMEKPVRSRIQNLLANLYRSEKGRVILKRAGLTRLKETSDYEYDVHRKIVFDVLGEKY